ncbi:MAG: hypothetical protein JW895_10665 [Thermoleophilaceae bacterium]|nr:hypothetical protein [Thermoleophilaceae bacterium]
MLTVVLVGFALYSRNESSSSRNRVVRATPRRRRYVPPWTLRAMKPLFAYNHNRDAYILRGVGKRFGPVLRNRDEQRRRTGRFDREARSEDLVER